MGAVEILSVPPEPLFVRLPFRDHGTGECCEVRSKQLVSTKHQKTGNTFQGPRPLDIGYTDRYLRLVVPGKGQ